MLRFALLVFAVAVFVLIALDVLTSNIGRWEAGALAAFIGSFLLPIVEFNEVRTGRRIL